MLVCIHSRKISGLGRERLTDTRQHWAVTDGTVGTKEDEVVREFGGSNTKIGLRFLLPYILKVLAVRSNDREAGLKRGIKACGADQDIDGVLVAIVANTASLGNVSDFAVDDLDIFLTERLEVTHAWCQSSTADMPVRDQVLLEVWVMQLLLHLRLHVGFGLIVSGGSLEENAKLAV